MKYVAYFVTGSADGLRKNGSSFSSSRGIKSFCTPARREHKMRWLCLVPKRSQLVIMSIAQTRDVAEQV
jgi:hypothetical protein